MNRHLPDPNEPPQMTLPWLLVLVLIGLGVWGLIIVIARWIIKDCCNG